MLREYAEKNSYIIYGTNKPTTVSYSSSATPYVLDIVITKDLVSPVNLTTCSALSSDHLPILIDTHCRSNFLRLPGFEDLLAQIPGHTTLKKTGSRLIAAVKQRWAWLVLGRVTAWEHHVPLAFWGQQASRGHRPRWPGRLNKSRSTPVSRAPFGYPD